MFLLAFLGLAGCEPAPPPPTVAPPPVPITHGGVVTLVDLAHNVAYLEVFAHPEGVVMWLYDEQMTPRDIPTGVGPWMRVGEEVLRHDMAVDGPRASRHAALLPGSRVEVSVEMQIHGSLKPSTYWVEVPVAASLPRDARRHGGTVVPLGESAVEYVATERGHHVWVTGPDGTPKKIFYQARLSDGLHTWETRGTSEPWTVPDPDAGAAPAELFIAMGIGTERVSGTFVFPAQSACDAAPPP